ncbi:MAG: hypothetical protein MUF54_00085 [Polyangiaceae bacterium]|jgi:hypothetical protein|nr:hypothetical protein [Polyangiaceae bacterium]
MRQVPPNPQDNQGLPDGTKSANSGGCCTTGTDLTLGFHRINAERIPMFSNEVAGGENTVGDPWTYGGFLGRPRGDQR